MFIVLEISPESQAVLAGHARLAGRVGQVARDCLLAAAAAGADHVGELMQTQQLPLKSRRGALGTAAQVSSWELDARTAAVGVPAEAEAHAWAAIQEEGGVIAAAPGRALAIPLTPEAARYTSPRDAPVELAFISRDRQGKPPLLAQVLARGGALKPWYVLVKSVSLRATHWLSIGVAMSMAAMVEAFQRRLDQETGSAMDGGR